MKKKLCCMIAILLLLTSIEATALTRSEATSYAVCQATVSLNSLDVQDTSPNYWKLWQNVFHPKYLANGEQYSPFRPQWPIAEGVVLYYSWNGVPYAWGGRQSSDTAQENIYNGFGVGTLIGGPSGQNVNNWAAGVDCSGLVCMASDRGTGCTVATLAADPNVHGIDWDELLEADLLISSSHVMMFVEWVVVDQSFKIVHASFSNKKVVYRTYNVIDFAGQYTPYRDDIYEPTSVEDISYFIKKPGSGCNPVEMAYLVTSPDSVALYVADNSRGPAYFRTKWFANGGHEEYVQDAFGQYNTDLVYFLDHGEPSAFVDKRFTSDPELFPIQSGSVYRCGGAGNRPVLAPPTNLVVTDTPYDRGGRVNISWDLSTNDNQIDCYRIFDPSSWRAEVPKGTNFYQAYSGTGVENDFRVSSAHGVVEGISGFWNDFSQYASGSSVDNFAHRNLVLSWPDVIYVCPGVGGFYQTDTLRTILRITGSDNSPTEGV
ncbi:MAG: hypothetical protein HY770_07775, partial [Chitinivibrionia bacterium]|nr:hypothetical protein [Chitinivibrionia bacterium]